MSGVKDQNNFIDVICQYTATGNIIPLRIRVRDTDGEYHCFTIKGLENCHIRANINRPTEPWCTVTHGVSNAGYRYLIPLSLSDSFSTPMIICGKSREFHKSVSFFYCISLVLSLDTFVLCCIISTVYNPPEA